VIHVRSNSLVQYPWKNNTRLRYSSDPREKAHQKKTGKPTAPTAAAPVIYEPETSAVTKTANEKNPNPQPIELNRLYP
jgi:hypothetical protein